MQKVWFITGTSRGFGREWAIAALERGDKVVATARDLSTISGLSERFGDLVLPLRMDVTDKKAVDRSVVLAHEHFGRLDVIVNNAGYGLIGMIEEASEEEVRAQFEVNFFGALWVTQAALPIMREQKSGHIIQVSSIAGVSAFKGTGLYASSKWALEGFSQALAQEVEVFNIAVTIIEPGGYATGWSESATLTKELSAYKVVKEAADAARVARMSQQGSPYASRVAILEIVDSPHPPLRLFLGEAPFESVFADYASRLATWEEWKDLSIRAQG